MPMNPRRTRGQTSRAKQLRADATIPERVLWNILRNRQGAGLKFRRQQPIGNYIADFACEGMKLIVELDGRSHDGNRGYDDDRTRKLNELGWKVYRVTNDDVLDDVESVAIAIAREAGIDVVSWMNGKLGDPIPTVKKPPSPYPSPPKTVERGQLRTNKGRQDDDQRHLATYRIEGA